MKRILMLTAKFMDGTRAIVASVGHHFFLPRTSVVHQQISAAKSAVIREVSREGIREADSLDDMRVVKETVGFV